MRFICARNFIEIDLSNFLIIASLQNKSYEIEHPLLPSSRGIKIIRNPSIAFHLPSDPLGKKSGGLFFSPPKNRNAPAAAAAADELESWRGSGAFFALVVVTRNSSATRRILGRRAENKSAEAQRARAPVNIRRKEKTKR